MIDSLDILKEQYSRKYDFNFTTLTSKDLNDIKELVKEKRNDTRIAPIGDRIFDWIREKTNNEIVFELVDFSDSDINGVLYIPKKGSNKAYIVLNSTIPLVDQIFTAAHEYYHYIHDYVQVKDNPIVCKLSNLVSLMEKRASRFAAELLLPEEALVTEINRYKINNGANLEDIDYAVIVLDLTIKYQLPIKAVLNRLHEEGYIKKETFMYEADLIQKVLLKLEIIKNKVNYLYSNKNDFVTDENIYHNLETVYQKGYASREEILRDASTMNLNMDIVESIFEEEETNEEDDLDDYLDSIINGGINEKL